MEHKLYHSLRDLQRQKMGWFDINDKLISPPSDNEPLDIVSVATSELGSLTIMDYNTATALFETADDLEVLRDLPQSLLVGLCLRVVNSATKSERSLRRLSKAMLIEKLRDAVRRHHQALSDLPTEVMMIIEEGQRDC